MGRCSPRCMIHCQRPHADWRRPFDGGKRCGHSLKKVKVGCTRTYLVVLNFVFLVSNGATWIYPAYCCIVLYTLYCIALYCLYCIVFGFIVLYCALLYCIGIVFSCTVLYWLMFYCNVLYCIVHIVYRTIGLYCTEHCYKMSVAHLPMSYILALNWPLIGPQLFLNWPSTGLLLALS